MHRAKHYGDQALAAFGLQTRRTAMDFLFPAIGLFGLGLVVGAGMGLIMAPKPGRELRGDIGRRVGDVAARLKHARKNGESQLDSNRQYSEVESGMPTYGSDYSTPR
jgi:gas vesicle protein